MYETALDVLKKITDNNLNEPRWMDIYILTVNSWTNLMLKSRE